MLATAGKKMKNYFLENMKTWKPENKSPWIPGRG
jgi:hypothetical protein